MVSKDGITCYPAKVEAVKDQPTPTNKSEIRSILVLIGYYRKFIPDSSERASPLTKVTRKKAKFQWNEECDHTFQDLKDCLINSPVLAFPKCSGTFVLDCDASSYA